MFSRDVFVLIHISLVISLSRREVVVAGFGPPSLPPTPLSDPVTVSGASPLTTLSGDAGIVI